MTHIPEKSAVDGLRHAVEIYQQAEEDFIGGGTILVNPAQIAQDGDAGHILSMERQDARLLLAHVGRFLWWRHRLVYVLVLLIVGSGDFGE